MERGDVVAKLCANPNSASTPMCAFIPKYHCALLRLRACGSRSPLRFFVDDGASMMLASTIVPLFKGRPRTSNTEIRAAA